MSEPTGARIKEFWEWCGFKFSEHIFGCWYPDDKLCHKEQPPIDLDNLFKYAVPKLEDDIGYKETFKLLIKWVIGVLGDEYEEPAYGLFWLIGNRALWQVKEKSNE